MRTGANPVRDDPVVTDLVARAGSGDKQAWDALVDQIDTIREPAALPGPPVPYAEISARLGIPVGSIGPNRGDVGS